MRGGEVERIILSFCSANLETLKNFIAPPATCSCIVELRIIPPTGIIRGYEERSSNGKLLCGGGAQGPVLRVNAQRTGTLRG